MDSSNDEVLRQRSPSVGSIIEPLPLSNLISFSTPLTEENETALLSAVLKFEELKQAEQNPNQRLAMADYLYCYAERAVKEEIQDFQPIVAVDLHDNDTSAASENDSLLHLGKTDVDDQIMGLTSLKRKNPVDRVEVGTGEVERVGKKVKMATLEVEDDDRILNFEPIVVNLSREISASDFEAARENLFNGLKAFEPHRRKNGRFESTKFSPSEAFDITDFLLTAILGDNLQQRMAALVTCYNSRAIYDVDTRVSGSRAMSLATREGTSPTLRDFYLSYSLVYEQKFRTETVYSDLIGYKEKAELRANLDVLMGEALKRGQRQFKYPGKFDAKSKVNKYLIQEHICGSLGITRTDLKKTRRKSGQIHDLVRYFGHGILLLLPQEEGFRLRKWHSKPLDVAYKLLNEALPQLNSVLEMFVSRLYEPILARQPLPDLPEDFRRLSLEQMLLDFDPVKAK